MPCSKRTGAGWNWAARMNRKPLKTARSSENPLGGWYGLKKGLRGRFGMYIPPLMEALGMVELEHNARGNRMRAIER